MCEGSNSRSQRGLGIKWGGGGYHWAATECIKNCAH